MDDNTLTLAHQAGIVPGRPVTAAQLAELVELARAAEREAIMDEWSACVQSDLENGVRWLNEQAAKKWQESYPAMAGFADSIRAWSKE